MKAAEIRSRFIDYFKRQKHEHVPSSRLVPENDPTLLFTNSGMVQFKNVFLGYDKRAYKRATTFQKCVRAGGKHNDLENVGHTFRHHTFFEMLGNFSFGDYFKKEAIHFAWDFLTNDLKIPKDRLYVTVFRDDDEAFGIWTSQEKIPADRISRFDEKDNFWQMGDTGPCGPCSEIFYDHGPENGCGKTDCKVGCSCDRFVEIWNLVFMQFNKDEKGKLTPLPKPSIDTGSGLERVSAVMQGVPSNYDTDLFQSFFRAMERVSKKPYKEASEDAKVAMRVVADHARAAVFLIADNVLPSNEGQGYVLRRIMRRGIRYGRKLSTLSMMMPAAREVIATMSDAYPELTERKDFILSTIENEEIRFNATIDQGTELLEQALNDLKAKGKKTVPGETVFKLYDTFGFPMDLTNLIAREGGFEVDEDSFNRLMEKARETAKASWKGGSGDQESGLLLQASSTLPKTEFIGYEATNSKSKVLALFKNGARVKELVGTGAMVVDKTPFYAEGGGQVGDQGTGQTESHKFVVHDTRKFGEVFFHNLEGANLKEGESVELMVSPQRRATMSNHSATHLLHAALRKVLGTHVTQAGSLVEPARLRFDFTHPKPMTAEEIAETERLVNEEISQARDVDAQVMGYKDAMTAGAMALFGEKYGDKVRVIKMGDFSTELCGGTHVHNTGVIRVFKITSEGGVSAGVRRIEGITGDAAVNFLMKRHADLTTIEGFMKVAEGKGLERIQKVFEQSKKLERDLKQARVQGQSLNVDDIVSKAREVKGAKVISQVVDLDDRDLLSSLSDRIKDKLRSGVVILIGSPTEGGSCPLVVSVTKDLAGKFHAGQILKNVAAVMDGKGGGRPDFAQGAAPTASKAGEAAQKAFDLL